MDGGFHTQASVIERQRGKGALGSQHSELGHSLQSCCSCWCCGVSLRFSALLLILRVFLSTQFHLVDRRGQQQRQLGERSYLNVICSASPHSLQGCSCVTLSLSLLAGGSKSRWADLPVSIPRCSAKFIRGPSHLSEHLGGAASSSLWRLGGYRNGLEASLVPWGDSRPRGSLEGVGCWPVGGADSFFALHVLFGP